MKDHFCQSCGMPIGSTNEYYGKNGDGSKNKDYCSYCYDDGQFKNDCSMEEMVQVCVPHVLKKHPSMTEEQARKMMLEFFPTLARWK